VSETRPRVANLHGWFSPVGLLSATFYQVDMQSIFFEAAKLFTLLQVLSKSMQQCQSTPTLRQQRSLHVTCTDCLPTSGCTTIYPRHILRATDNAHMTKTYGKSRPAGILDYALAYYTAVSCLAPSHRCWWLALKITITPLVTGWYMPSGTESLSNPT
jgi:hypothetical protein